MANEQLKQMCDQLDHDARDRQHRLIADELQECPKLLYHYTTADGLIGILNTGTLWATHIAYLNDTMEGCCGAEMIAEELAVGIKESLDHEVRDVLALCKYLLTQPSGALDRYVVSFCRDCEVANQWQSYGANGTGYAVGFDTDRFRLTPVSDVGYALLPMIYCKDRQRALVRDAVQWISERYVFCRENYPNVAHTNRRAFCALRFQNDIYYFQSIFKHSAFSSEREWRFVVLHDPHSHEGQMVKVRLKGGQLTPYLELDMHVGPHNGKLPIERLVVGPACNAELTERALRYLVRQVRSGCVDVSLSQVPLRA
jgi:hypothetical protein